MDATGCPYVDASVPAVGQVDARDLLRELVTSGATTPSIALISATPCRFAADPREARAIVAAMFQHAVRHSTGVIRLSAVPGHAIRIAWRSKNPTDAAALAPWTHVFAKLHGGELIETRTEREHAVVLRLPPVTEEA